MASRMAWRLTPYSSASSRSEGSGSPGARSPRMICALTAA